MSATQKKFADRIAELETEVARLKVRLEAEQDKFWRLDR